jgi:hypothetical protein
VDSVLVLRLVQFGELITTCLCHSLQGGRGGCQVRLPVSFKDVEEGDQVAWWGTVVVVHDGKYDGGE